MSDATKPLPWHVCLECLDPLANGLAEIVADHHRPMSRSPLEPGRRIERLLKQLHFDTASDWLKFNVSVGYARDIEKKVRGPLRRLNRLSFRCCQLLNGDTEGRSQTTVRWRTPIDEYLRFCFDYWDRRQMRWDEIEDQGADPELLVIADKYERVFLDIRRTIEALRVASAMIKAKLVSRLNASTSAAKAAGQMGGQEAVTQSSRRLGRPTEQDRDAELQRRWESEGSLYDSKAAFARANKMKPSAMRKALKRASRPE